MDGIDAILENPETPDCVKHVNSVAESNWKNFIDSKQFTPLQGHILKYPVEVDRDGNVKSMPGHETFPDVGGRVLGTSIRSKAGGGSGLLVGLRETVCHRRLPDMWTLGSGNNHLKIEYGSDAKLRNRKYGSGAYHRKQKHWIS